MAMFAGIDLGTSSLKCIIVDELGAVISSASRDYQFDAPVQGFAQQQTEIWWEACCYCVSKAIAKAGIEPVDIQGVSFSGQMHGLVMLDSEGQVLYPSILHCDSRSDKQVREIKQVLGSEYIKSHVINPIYTGFLLPSLLWIRDNEPEIFAEVRHVFMPKDFLRYMMTGEINSDYSDASATLAFDIAAGEWSHDIIKKFDLDISIFPKCFWTDEVTGYVTRKAAEQTGLAEKTPVIAGGGDQIMQAIGNGVYGLDKATINIGSSGQVCYQSDRVIKNPLLSTNTFCGYKNGRWITMGATMTAGLSFKWFNSLFDNVDYRAVDEGISRIEPGSEGLIFLPYLNGERTPHANPNLSGMFAGLNLSTNRYHMARSVLEGVTYSLYQCMEACNDLGIDAESMIASGGGAKSDIWLRIQADVFNKPIKVASVSEQASVGAAIAASVGSGYYRSIDEACSVMVKYQDKIHYPDAANHAKYSEYYQLYKKLYEKSHEELEELTIMGRC